MHTADILTQMYLREMVFLILLNLERLAQRSILQLLSLSVHLLIYFITTAAIHRGEMK